MIPGHFMNVRMWPQILHHCQACGLDTNVPYRASVFSEAQYCQHCGSVSSGATVRTEQDLRDHAAATANMAQQEELARLFASTMTFSNPTPPPEEPTVVPEHYQPCPPHQPIEEPKKVYASTHYVPPTSFGSHSTPQSTPEPEPQPLSDNQIAEMLIQHNIDPHSLFPSQVTLFRNADSDQRQRLLELWRISPPNFGSYDISKEQANWLETTMAKEEEVARLRYERAVIEAQGIGSPHNMPQEPSRPSSAPATSSNANAEPYMTNGYELLAQREYEKTGYTQATDPVYNTQMENNYGQFAAAREGGMASMNGLDDEMIM